MASGKYTGVNRIFRRKKEYDNEELESSDLKRCLNLWDLLALGAGGTLGVGVHVVIGSVALSVAGPSVVISFVIAAVAAALAGLCFAEWGARVPQSGVTYNYTQVALGELAAFLIGWCNILDGIFGSASIASGLSVLVDQLSNGSMSSWFREVAPINQAFLSPYFNFFSFFVVLVLGAILIFGVREASFLNILFAAVNMCVVVFVIIAGALKANTENWSLPSTEVPDPSFGSGGFFPYGGLGTLKGAAFCFYGFVGFEAINAAAEEVENPRKNIPKSILLAILVSTLSYVGVAVVVTMMTPYYTQDLIGGVGSAFSSVGWEWAMWIVQIGAVFGILSSLFGTLFPVTRLLRCMSRGGLLHPLGVINTKGTPVGATVLTVAVVACLAGIFTLRELVLTLCVGTLGSYTLVAAGVIVMRCRSSEQAPSGTSYIRQMFSFRRGPASRTSSRIVATTLFFFVSTCILLGVVYITTGSQWGTGVLGVVGILLMLLMSLQPSRQQKLHFTTPLVPLVPCLSIASNLFMITLLEGRTWIRVAIWMLIGIIVYMLSFCCNKHKKSSGNLEGNINEAFTHTEVNGKLPVHIVVEEPTPPVNKRDLENYDRTINRPLSEEFKADIVDLDVNVTPILRQNITLASYTVETIEQQSVIDENEGGEAKIIDLLDQVLQAEEDSYGEISNINEGKSEDVLVSTAPEPIPHRKSLGELSDADSDASLSNPGLSQYDVVAQVHREDLPKVDEEYNEDEHDIQVELHDAERATFFNDSETASRTDESGYSDTTDNNHIHDSIEELKSDIDPYIPPPPPPPPPPPFIENLYTNPPFMKSYSMSPRPKPKPVELEKEIPRESVISNASHDDKTIVFGSARQMTFADKLSGILMKQMTTSEPEGMKRSNSAGNVVEAIEMSKERPSIMLELHKELLAREVAHSLRPIIKAAQENNEVDDNNKSDEDLSMTREDLKLKLEDIFANGGTQLGKPRLIKIHSQEDNSSLESAIVKAVTKVEKSDTLKMQKAKFSEVLNAIKLGHNIDDHV